MAVIREMSEVGEVYVRPHTEDKCRGVNFLGQVLRRSKLPTSNLLALFRTAILQCPFPLLSFFLVPTMTTLDCPQTNKTLAILDAAAKGSYGVLAAIAYNVEQITALVRAAEASKSPLILQLFPSTLKQLPSLVWAASAAAKATSIPISLHLDHAQDEDDIRQIAKTLPFDSIMVDMSHYEHHENLQKTKELVAVCHEYGIAVEAESGRINGGEDGIADTGELEGQ